MYGAAVLMPQLARTAGWHRSFLPHAARSGAAVEDVSLGLEQLLLPLRVHVRACDDADLRV